MERYEVRVAGNTYPCRMTMGALRRYKRLSGKEASEVDFTSVVDVTELVYCCVASACAADKVDFPLTIDDFCDALGPEDFAVIAGVIAEQASSAPGEKKSL